MLPFQVAVQLLILQGGVRRSSPRSQAGDTGYRSLPLSGVVNIATEMRYSECKSTNLGRLSVLDGVILPYMVVILRVCRI